jgi:hypothetical protein
MVIYVYTMFLINFLAVCMYVYFSNDLCACLSFRLPPFDSYMHAVFSVLQYICMNPLVIWAILGFSRPNCIRLYKPYFYVFLFGILCKIIIKNIILFVPIFIILEGFLKFTIQRRKLLVQFVDIISEIPFVHQK